MVITYEFNLKTIKNTCNLQCIKMTNLCDIQIKQILLKKNSNR